MVIQLKKRQPFQSRVPRVVFAPMDATHSTSVMMFLDVRDISSFIRADLEYISRRAALTVSCNHAPQITPHLSPFVGGIEQAAFAYLARVSGIHLEHKGTIATPRLSYSRLLQSATVTISLGITVSLPLNALVFQSFSNETRSF